MQAIRAADSVAVVGKGRVETRIRSDTKQGHRMPRRVPRDTSATLAESDSKILVTPKLQITFLHNHQVIITIPSVTLYSLHRRCILFIQIYMMFRFGPSSRNVKLLETRPLTSLMRSLVYFFFPRILSFRSFLARSFFVSFVSLCC